MRSSRILEVEAKHLGMASERLLRRLTENDVPNWAGFWFGFKARQLAPSGLCKGCRNPEDGR